MHLSDLFQAYFDCRSRKRRTTEAMRFEEHFEQNCIQLHHEIICGIYTPAPYKLIYVTDPVMREIFVPTFRDRVIHYLLANWLRPRFEKFFIHDNYAGREGRGTLFGIRRAEKFVRQVTHNYQREAFVLKLDIASYFRNIPKEILWDNLQKIIQIESPCQGGCPQDRGFNVSLLKFNSSTPHLVHRHPDYSTPFHQLIFPSPLTGGHQHIRERERESL